MFILTCLNFSHLQNTLYLMQQTYWDDFPLLKTVFELINFDDFLVPLPFFVSLFPHQQNISLWGLFSSRETNKKSCLGQDQVNRKSREWGSCHFGSKTAEHNTVWAGTLVNHPSWNGQIHWKSLQKNSQKPNTASHNNSSWHTDTHGFLEHSPSKGSLCHHRSALQNIILFWGASPFI